MKKLLTSVLMAAAAFAAEGYKVINKIKIGGTGGWDYVALDNTNRRLYASHGDHGGSGGSRMPARWSGRSPQLHGVHGIAIAPDLNKGFITNGQSNSVTIFDLKTLAEDRRAGHRQESRRHLLRAQDQAHLHLQPQLQRCHGHRRQDQRSASRRFPSAGKPRELRGGRRRQDVRQHGRLAARSSRSTPRRPAVTRRASLAPCEGPSGLAIDVKNKKLFSVCGNKMMAVIDIPTLKVVATPAIGAGHRRRRLRSRHGPRLQLQRRRHADHRQAGQRQVRSRGHRPDRARRPHHDRRREDAPRLSAGRRIRSRPGGQRRQEGPPAGAAGQLPRPGGRKVDYSVRS